MSTMYVYVQEALNINPSDKIEICTRLLLQRQHRPPYRIAGLLQNTTGLLIELPMIAQHAYSSLNVQHRFDYQSGRL